MMHEYAQHCLLKNELKEELKEHVNDYIEDHINDYMNDKINKTYNDSLTGTIIYYSISCIMLGGSIYFIYWIKKTIKSIFCIIEQQQNQSKIMLSIQNELVNNYTYCKKYVDQHNIEINNIFTHLNNLENKYYHIYKSVNQSNIDINNLMKRLNDIESRYSLIERYINFDDKYKQILIGFHRNIKSNLPKFDQSIFCPKYATNLDKYIGNNGIVFFLPCLAQLPYIKKFELTKIYNNEQDYHLNMPIYSFIDYQYNEILCVKSTYFFGEKRTKDENADNLVIKQIKEFCSKIKVECV